MGENPWENFLKKKTSFTEGSMKKSTKFFTLPFCALIAILAAFLFVSPAFAQDEMPPEATPTEVPTEVVATEVAPTDIPPAETATVEAVPTEIAPIELLPTEAAPGELLPAEVAPEGEASTAGSNLAEQLNDSGVVFSFPDGTEISMAEKDAQEKINSGDPWFFVGAVEHDFVLTGADCTPSATLVCHWDDHPIQAAINAVKNDGLLPNTGGIYVMPQALPYEEEILIDGVMGLKALWGTVGSRTLEPMPIIKGSITVTNMPSGFHIGGFVIQGTAGDAGHPKGAIDISSSAGTIELSTLVVSNSNPLGQGIAIGEDPSLKYLDTHTRTVVMSNVDCSDNAGGGALITANGAVTIKNSSFEDNKGDSYVNGLYIDTNGAITADGVSVSRNGESYTDPNNTRAGLFIENSKTITIKNSVFNDNYATAAFNHYNPALGAIILDNVTASNNRHFIDIDHEFGGAGIVLMANGNITANKITATGNKFNGMLLDTCNAVETPALSGNWVCSTTVVGNVVISNSQFSHNITNGSGLLVDAKGSITLTNVDASYNRGINRPIIDPPTPGDGSPTSTSAGARLNNYSFTTAFPVTVNSSTFLWNSDDGLEIYSKGLVTINKVQADRNGIDVDEFGNFVAAYGGFGLDIDNTDGLAGVTFNGTSWSDNSASSNAHGLRINTKGTILLNFLDSTNNIATDAELTNDYLAGNVTINKSSFNGSWSGNGLDVDSLGVISLSSVCAVQNFLGGANLDNSLAGSAKAVTITNSTFSSNQGTGLYVRSKGAITLKNAQAFDNSVHQVDFPDDVYTVHDVFGINGSEDLWMVNVTDDMLGVPYYAELGSAMANGIIDIRDPSGETDYTDTAVNRGDLYVAEITDFTFDETGWWTFALSEDSSYLPVGYYFSTNVLGASTGDDYFGNNGADLDNTSGTAGVTITNAAFPLYEWGEIIPVRDFNSNNATGLLIKIKGGCLGHIRLGFRERPVRREYQ